MLNDVERALVSRDSMLPGLAALLDENGADWRSATAKAFFIPEACKRYLHPLQT
ncbi:hypothetical protein ACLB1R_00885 [Escherichia coli]